MPLTAPATPVTLDSIRGAARVLEGVAVRTPLRDAPDLSERVGVPVSLKCELLQPIGAFKIRGAYHALARLVGRGGAQGVVTASSGNHGQALAFAARQFGLRAVSTGSSRSGVRSATPSSTRAAPRRAARVTGGVVARSAALDMGSWRRVGLVQLGIEVGRPHRPTPGHAQ
ncbi:MAG TPA: pyridoxal-phosphate dependent enzyme [Gemmatimonadales bacterium]|nr:pyridoxal-phosphate dependent enzyme [Gemmatimonadales bacterium]